MRQPPHELMLFAAGFGSRMQPLTADLPKPLITVAGTSLLDRTLRLAEAGGIT
ncbi:sugar phosphate nucleotidyltransferase, partial [Planktomarina temperata]|nr:sugar phosphate nucleotidyltransferase [Planktomarina temperata]